MSLGILLLENMEAPGSLAMVRAWPAALREKLPEAEVHLAADEDEAMAVIGTVDAAYGRVGPALFAKAPRLRWIQSAQAGPDPSFYHAALVESDVVVTNMRGIFSDHISAHILALMLSFSRGLPVYQDRQRAHVWQPGAATIFLPEATAVIVGVGAIGAETARQCNALGITVVGVDPRVETPPPGVARLVGHDALDTVLPEADFVVVTAPETPATQRLFDAGRFACMKPGAIFINIGRGATVVLDDLADALHAGTIAGAALDVFETEPLPDGHALWDAPGMLITPHVATAGPYLNERRTEVFLDNCRRFAVGESLRNVVDKENWF